MRHIVEIEQTTLFNDISEGDKTFVILKYGRQINKHDEVIFEYDAGDKIHQEDRVVTSVETDGLKSGYVAFQFKEKE